MYHGGVSRYASTVSHKVEVTLAGIRYRDFVAVPSKHIADDLGSRNASVTLDIVNLRITYLASDQHEQTDAIDACLGTPSLMDETQSEELLRSLHNLSSRVHIVYVPVVGAGTRDITSSPGT